MKNGSAQAFADGWVAAWNAHDIEAVLSHFADNARFTSPVAHAILDGSDGVLVGKDAIRAYWAEGIKQIPDLHFEVVGTYVGVDLLVINYLNQRGVLVCEVLRFDGDLVVDGGGTYLGTPI